MLYPVMFQPVIKSSLFFFFFFSWAYSLIICVVLFRECHIMCFSDLREAVGGRGGEGCGGLQACGWLNNESGLRGNEELRHSIRTVVSLFSPLVRSGTTEMLLM